MAKKPDPERKPREEPNAPPALSSDEVLGDMIDSGFDVEVDDDGQIKIHAKCGPGDDPAECAERVRFLVEALGTDLPPPDLMR